MIRFTRLFGESHLGEPHLLLDPYSDKSGTGSKQEFPLVAGFVCPSCTNVLWALFLTDRQVDVRPYEEVRTQLKDNNGCYRYIQTGLLKSRNSLYEQSVLSDRETVSAQMIWLREHFERMTGEEKSTICKYRARHSMRPDIPLKEALLWSRPHSTFTFKAEEMGNIKNKVSAYTAASERFKHVSDFAGKLPDLWLLGRESDTWYLENCLSKWVTRNK